MALIGCTPLALQVHLENQFHIGMDWSNYGYWHIDHIQPLSAFNLSDQDQQALAFHYTNLQPMWGVENIRKGGLESPCPT